MKAFFEDLSYHQSRLHTGGGEGGSLQMFFQHILISLNKNKAGRAAAWRPRAPGRRNLVTGTHNNAN